MTHDDDQAELTLRGGGDEIVGRLKRELQERFEKAGLHVEDARLTHLAYAPEIAGAMLRRQQAEAVIGARKQIVLGAVSMVEMALKGLTERGVVELDDERKAAMVSNLLVVLCAETEAQPVINAGSLYQLTRWRLERAAQHEKRFCCASIRRLPPRSRRWRLRSCAASTARSSGCCARRWPSAAARSTPRHAPTRAGRDKDE